ncbi:dienelactone hydrolase [Sphingomonas vulcanisoli]|uniref:Dienelactone hydrolase n=1 Tax=Sphingomonas vulcanisoli TaxID=1658060 RepID=A0ABX0TU51_9SPHN|nr:alpha/beta fold hydrolase [Sphingomonas vulcanisoli]NIJ08553.1 dienelactone hydrolase [Sphingomonas vulcanisoli]
MRGNSWLSVILSIAALVCFAPGALAAPTQQIIQLKAADGRAVPALVTYPEGGPDTQAPVAIIHHGGPGGHPLRSLSAARWAADYFAGRGYITISIMSRIGRDVIDQPFGAQAADIKGAVDWASQLSHGPIVLVGHSSGSVSVTYYEATTQDPRVKAIVHFAPTFPGSLWMPTSMGRPRYDAVVARLKKLVADGKGDQPIYEDHHLAPPAPQDITYGYLMSAKVWLSWWGPDSKQNNLALFPNIRVPMLMISGDKDIFASRAYQEELKKAAVNSPRVDAIILDGGIPHEFVGAEVKAPALAYDWLAEVGIRPSPRIATHVVDMKLSAYDIRPGVIYEPADAGFRKPLAVMLMPDFADDVMLTPFDEIGPRLAKAGYTVLIPQDSGSGWPLYRSVAGTVSTNQRAWLKYLADQGHAQVAIVAHGQEGVMVPALLPPIAQGPSIAGVALIQPPGAPAAFAQDVLGAQPYAKALADADAAVKRGAGGTTMIIVPYRSNGRDPATHKWLNYMASSFLSYWGPSAPVAPVPALTAAGEPVLLIDADKGRFLSRDAQTSLAKGGVSSLWYDKVASPFDDPDRLAADLAKWLDALPKQPEFK